MPNVSYINLVKANIHNKITATSYHEYGQSWQSSLSSASPGGQLTSAGKIKHFENSSVLKLFYLEIMMSIDTLEMKC